MSNQQNGWQFYGQNGEFKLEAADEVNYLYFPLANEAGMMSAITPQLHGDLKTGQDTFALEPVSAVDLHNKKSARNFWLQIDGEEVWSAVGNSARQKGTQFTDSKVEETTVKAGLLWQQVTRKNRELEIKSEITSFVPAADDTVELMKVTITNQSDQQREITPIAAIPIYGRSADNLRDHRHVTSLLHRIKTIDNGVEVQPTLSFDERGHQINDVCYKVLGAEEAGQQPVDFCPVFEDFIGEGGSLEWPKAVVGDSDNFYKAGETWSGYEAVGALRFASEVIEPSEQKSYIIAIAIDEDGELENIVNKYCTEEKFDFHLEQTKDFWQQKVNKVQFNSGNNDFDQWMKWVTLQPMLRKIYGCSFLPHHDYGRGGRGWRDLWQDCLALLLVEPKQVRDLLHNNFAGVRIDGSNATIIGDEPGEFIADRNDISRAWIDHGAWPWITTKLYIDQSGDLEFLLDEQSYFQDAQLHRTQKLDEDWSPEGENKLLDKEEEVYQGTVIEHLLVQHLSVFFNVGKHNNLKLEGGDWNDGLDMAPDQGESVTFSALYGSNLLEIADMLRKIKSELGIEKLQLAKEIGKLLDTLDNKIDYDSPAAKQELLTEYFTACERKISGDQIEIKIEDLIRDLERKGNWIKDHIRADEWLEDKAGYNWFNGYYDNQAQQVEGDYAQGVRMTLTGQVFPIMGEVATKEQVSEIIKTADHYLKDDSVGGYRLNTNFNEVKLDLGRAFGFAFGHKENGAMFSHMAMMYSNALYQRDYVQAGYEVIDSLYQHCQDFSNSKIYPGIPEYINQRGRGMYHYLTGSASWLLLTMVSQIYGVRGALGDLVLEPKLVTDQFDNQNQAGITTLFAGRKLEVIYNNPELLSAKDYEVTEVKIDGKAIDCELDGGQAVIDREVILALTSEQKHRIEVSLA